MQALYAPTTSACKTTDATLQAGTKLETLPVGTMACKREHLGNKEARDMSGSCNQAPDSGALQGKEQPPVEEAVQFASADNEGKLPYMQVFRHF